MTALANVLGQLPGEVTLDQLAETVRREHQLAEQSAVAMVEHAIRAGDALRAAKEQVGHGGWERWLMAEFPDKHPKTLRLYMRLSNHQDRVREDQPATIAGAQRLLLGEASRPNDAEMRDEARALAKQGMSRWAISQKLGVSHHAVGSWLDPRLAEKRRQRRRQESRAARRALHEKQRASEVRRAGGSIAEAYALLRKALQALERAAEENQDREVKASISLAMARLHSGEDHIVKASKLS